MLKKNILFIANNNIGNGLSGGDRIFLEFIRNWTKKLSIDVLGSEETEFLLKRYKIIPNKFYKTDQKSLLPLFIHVIRRIFLGINKISQIRNDEYYYIYSVSDFLPDLLPAIFYKFLHPKCKWIAGFYLAAPNPFSPNSPYVKNHLYIKGLLYFITQIPVKFLINKYADVCLITSKPDKKLFKVKTIIVQGGVDTSNSKKYSNSFTKKFSYDAVFIGRLHPQKGVLELIDIWKELVKKSKNIKLAIIGDGDLRSQVESKISKYKLEGNIKMFGFLDGKPKELIFKKSKIVLHPAIYDSGGMAAAEAMAWGLPGISYNLPALKTYYPKGMLKTKCFDKIEFANNIAKLLSDRTLYTKLSKEAKILIETKWSWHYKANDIYNKLFA